MTDSGKVFPSSVVGLFLEVYRGSMLVGAFRVVAQNGSVLTLASTVEGTVLPGDTYLGVMRLDGLSVGSHELFTTLDRIDAASVVPLGALPSATVSVSPGSSGPGQSFVVSVSAQDVEALSRVAVTASGAASFFQASAVTGVSASPSFTIQIPVSASPGSTIVVAVDVTDASGQTTHVPPITLTVSP